jgi:hypothetical protein
MAFTETPAEKLKRKAWEQANLDTARAKEAKADAEAARKFEETTNVDTSKNTNPMGDTYKKGGKVKKMADGGLSDEEISDKLGRLGLKSGTSDYRLGQQTSRADRTAQELEDLLPSREKIGAALRSKLDPETVLDAANPVGAVARRVAGVAKEAKMPKSYADAGGMKKGGKVKASSASKRADGCCVRGKTRA